MASAGNTDVQPQIAIICAFPQAFSWKSWRLRFILSLFSYGLFSSFQDKQAVLWKTDLNRTQPLSVFQDLDRLTAESPVLITVWTGGNTAVRQKSHWRNSPTEQAYILLILLFRLIREGNSWTWWQCAVHLIYIKPDKKVTVAYRTEHPDPESSFSEASTLTWNGFSFWNAPGFLVSVVTLASSTITGLQEHRIGKDHLDYQL